MGVGVGVGAGTAAADVGTGVGATSVAVGGSVDVGGASATVGAGVLDEVGVGFTTFGVSTGGAVPGPESPPHATNTANVARIQPVSKRTLTTTALSHSARANSLQHTVSSKEHTHENHRR